MTTGQLIVVDLLVAALAAGAWIGAGATAAAGRARVAAALLAAAVAVTLARAATVVPLAAAGWWFVQEKFVLTLPLLGATGLAATLLAAVPGRPGRHLLVPHSQRLPYRRPQGTLRYAGGPPAREASRTGWT